MIITLPRNQMFEKKPPPPAHSFLKTQFNDYSLNILSLSLQQIRIIITRQEELRYFKKEVSVRARYVQYIEV